MSYNVAQLLDQRAASQADEIALKIPFRVRSKLQYQEYTFQDLASISSDIAHYFTDQRISKGDRCLLLLRPGIELISICFALFKIGAIPVVIDPGMGIKSFLRCVNKVEPRFIIGLPLAITISRLFKKSFSSVDRKIPVSKKWLQSIPKRDLYKIESTQSDQLAAILFTSGSTGPPKGVCYEHRMFSEQVRMIRTAYNIKEGGVDLPMLPIFSLFNPALGMTTVIPEMNPSRPAKVDPQKIVDAILTNQVTNTFGSPALWAKISRYCKARKIILPSVETILIAGAPVHPSVLKMLKDVCPHANIHTPYGATECLPVSSIRSDKVLNDTWKQTVQGKGTCVGQPLPGVEVNIQNPDTNGIGEIVAHGPTVTKEYFRLPEATAKAKFTQDDKLWHRMGDLGYKDSQGRIWFCGRDVEAVHLNEVHYYTDCIEAIFNQHQKVFRTALIKYQSKPALVIETFPEYYTKKLSSQKELLAELVSLAKDFEKARDIKDFFFEKKFPVDVRHNAKIHRLSLTKKLAKKRSIQL